MNLFDLIILQQYNYFMIIFYLFLHIAVVSIRIPLGKTVTLDSFPGLGVTYSANLSLREAGFSDNPCFINNA
jgi:hypothetical protein